jgi:phosphoglycerol transferase MdoB-like AlkP superfamily enzyme
VEETHRQTLLRIRHRALLVLGLFVVAITLKVAVVQWMVLERVSLPGLALDALFAFVLLAAIDLFFADMRFRALMIADAAMSVLLAIIIVYHSYYGLLPGRESFSMLGQATTVGGSIASLLSPLLPLLFVDIPAFSWWVIRSRRRGLDPVTGRRPGVLIVPGLRTPYVYQRRLVYFAGLAAAIVFGLSVQAIRDSPGLIDAKVVAHQRGLMTYAAVALLGEQQSASAESLPVPHLQARIDELCERTALAPRAGFTPGAARGSNLIVLQIEALQTAAVGATVGGVPVTPNLDKLITESWYFPNHFSAAGLGTTSDAEYTVNTSLYPPQQTAASIAYAGKELSSLPRSLGASGYATYTFHTNDVEYWNRSQLYPAIGFSEYFDKSFFGTDDTIAFGASDRVLYDKTLERLVATAEAGTPFYAHVIAMSSHFPFTQVPVERRKVPMIEPYRGTIEGDYLTEIHYADEEIGRFVDELRRTGLFEQSILVIYGDHFGLPEPRNDKEAAALAALLGHDYTPVDKLATPLIVRLPGQEAAHQVNEPVGMVDFAPSVADALGAGTAGAARFGRSIFRSGGNLFSAGGLLPVGAYADDRVLYIPGATFSDGEVWDVATRTRLDVSAASEAKYEAVKELLQLSKGYVAGLPERPDYDRSAKRILPDELQ